MEKSKLIYVKLSKEQIDKIKEENNLKTRMKISHAIIWENHGQIFGEERLMSRFWHNWTLELSEKEKESHTDMRASFSDCIVDDDYEFEDYEHRDFRSQITEIQTRLSKELSDKRIQMVEDEYQKALERVRETSENYKPTLADKIKPVIFFIVMMVFLISVFSALK